MKKTIEEKLRIKAIFALKNMKWLTEKSKLKINPLTMNRVVGGAHTTSMAKSIYSFCIIRPVVLFSLNFISGVKELYLGDGSHLKAALDRLNLPMPYIVIPITDHRELITALAMFNSTSKTWILTDYIKAWGSLIPDYKTLNSYLHYDLETSVIAAVFHGIGLNSVKTGITKHIKEGTFRVNNEKQGKFYLDCMTSILKIVPRMDRNSNRTFVRAYYTFILENTIKYNHLKFCTFVKKHIEKFTFVNGDVANLNNFFLKAL